MLAVDSSASSPIGRISAPRRRWVPHIPPATLGVFALLLVVMALELPPVAGLIVGSLTSSLSLDDLSFSLDSLTYAYTTGQHYRSLLNSLLFATISASLVVMGGCALAWLVERTDSPLRKVTGFLTLVPILIPSVLFVAGWILMLGPGNGMINLLAMKYFGWTTPPFNIYSFWGMVFVGVLQELPLAFLWLRPAFRAMNPDLEDAAAISGAGAFTVARRISLPLLRPALVSGWIIFFIYSLGSLMVPLMIGRPAGIFLYSVEIYLATHRFPMDVNLANSFSLLFLFASIVGVIAYRRATRDKTKFVTVVGKSFQPRIVSLGRWKWPVTIGCFLFIVIGMGSPVLIFVWNAFLTFPQAPSMESLQYLTTGNFGDALGYGPAVRALTNSLLLGLLAGVITTVVGGLVAWTLLRASGPRWMLSLLDQLSTLPVAMPGMTVGVSLMWIFLLLPLPLYGTLWVLLFAYVVLFIPYAVRICGGGIIQMHQELEEAARISGATWLTVFRRIVLAIIVPSLASSMLYIGLRAFREYSASIFLVSPGHEVFSVLVLDMWDGGNFGILSAYVTMTTLVLCALVGLAALISRFGIGVAEER